MRNNHYLIVTGLPSQTAAETILKATRAIKNFPGALTIRSTQRYGYIIELLSPRKISEDLWGELSDTAIKLGRAILSSKPA